MHNAAEVLEFWFGRGPWDAARLAERSAFWFGGEDPAATAAHDAVVREKLEPLLELAARGEFASWAASPRRRLALIILFDQVPRNAYRGTAAALEPLERLFFYLPLEHAESLEAQETAVASLDRLADDAPEHLREYCVYCAGFARGHRDIIARFGRFPHRNAVLGRESTAAEIEWLAGEGERFGQ